MAAPLSAQEAHLLHDFLETDSDTIALPSVEYIIQHDSVMLLHFFLLINTSYVSLSNSNVQQSKKQSRLHTVLFSILFFMFALFIVVWHYYAPDVLAALSSPPPPLPPSPKYNSSSNNLPKQKHL